ncbi:hypothetical protein Q5P01_004459 [Channa striata]|uniref:Chemokine interleukin-8-like domain-containing protein n=1 Tax=Channa striata TaxID=64152 RepID=A0AA88NJ17_CHASR|nr:hypothetical protein Q5P01_004459 [Channa striata]
MWKTCWICLLAITGVMHVTGLASFIRPDCCTGGGIARPPTIQHCFEQKPRHGCKGHFFLIKTENETYCLKPDDKWLQDEIKKHQNIYRTAVCPSNKQVAQREDSKGPLIRPDCCTGGGIARPPTIQHCFEQKPGGVCKGHFFLIKTENKDYCLKPDDKWLQNKIKKEHLHCGPLTKGKRRFKDLDENDVK